ncbi:MAG: hypothetical protein FWB84_03660 [Candidatus Bathyarchaeota archaeon]|uniref:hypothetical protein n=1 Tax=Candidatus Bathycorpusculum sp. TaxID=2994959 RepID=UPI00281A7078|nr:hypothetical protein [Candidatus Termiticorpusculum sp.]MCL2292657.1 hypothetical protein [Candidatus Termiticorpusculum sp.]
MGIPAYENIPEEEITQERYTADGRSYTLDHPEELTTEMKYKGDQSNANSQGWERNSEGFFKELKGNHPEYFSDANSQLIDSGKAPIVDDQFVQHFPQYEAYTGDGLKHHHIGGGSTAVAVPEGYHTGYGGIHNDEKTSGIRASEEDFSAKVKGLDEAGYPVKDKTRPEIEQLMNEKQSAEGKAVGQSGDTSAGQKDDITTATGQGADTQPQPAKQSQNDPSTTNAGQNTGNNSSGSDPSTTAAGAGAATGGGIAGDVIAKDNAAKNNNTQQPTTGTGQSDPPPPSGTTKGIGTSTGQNGDTTTNAGQDSGAPTTPTGQNGNTSPPPTAKGTGQDGSMPSGTPQGADTSTPSNEGGSIAGDVIAKDNAAKNNNTQPPTTGTGQDSGTPSAGTGSNNSGNSSTPSDTNNSGSSSPPSSGSSNSGSSSSPSSDSGNSGGSSSPSSGSSGSGTNNSGKGQSM